MKAGHFNNNHVSTGDLNRPRSPEVRKPLVCFLVLFAQRKKNVKTSPLQGAPRFANLESAHRNGGFAQTKLKPFAASPLFPTFCKVQKVGQKTLKLSFWGKFRPAGQHALRAFFRLTAVSLLGRHTPCAFPCFLTQKAEPQTGSPQSRQTYISGAINFNRPPYSRLKNVFFFRSAARISRQTANVSSKSARISSMTGKSAK